MGARMVGLARPAQCWLTGQAAGVAAALAVNASVQPRGVDIVELQRALRAQGVYVREHQREPVASK